MPFRLLVLSSPSSYFCPGSLRFLFLYFVLSSSPPQYYTRIILKIIIRNKNRFISFCNNIKITISNSINLTYFYIMDISGIKVILGYPFFRKTKIILTYLYNKKKGPVYMFFADYLSGKLTNMRVNKDTNCYKEIRKKRMQERIGFN
jgi:hypothetical protein